MGGAPGEKKIFGCVSAKKRFSAVFPLKKKFFFFGCVCTGAEIVLSSLNLFASWIHSLGTATRVLVFFYTELDFVFFYLLICPGLASARRSLTFFQAILDS